MILVVLRFGEKGFHVGLEKSFCSQKKFVQVDFGTAMCVIKDACF